MTSMSKIGITSFATPSDTDVVITRVVQAPKRLAFAAYTEPQHLQKWLLGPPGWTMPVCELEARSGGAWRYVWRKADGTEMAMGGIVREFVPPERMVTTERWGPEWPETVNTVSFADAGPGHTTITLTISYPSKEARDAALKTGMKDGMESSFARLDGLLQTLR